MTNPINHSGLTTPAHIIPRDTPLLQMPLEIVTRIFTYLRGEEIAKSAPVCRQWNQMLKDDDLWGTLFSNRFPTVNSSRIKNFKSAYQSLDSNLRKGVYASATLKGHGHWVYSLAAFDGKLFSGSLEMTIKVWDLKTGQCTATLRGHEDSVYSLAIFDGKLFSGSYDGMIKVWDLKTGHSLETGECTATLKGYENAGCSLAVYDGKLFSDSDNNTIKVWDSETGECTATLKGHESLVCSLAVYDGKLFSGSSDSTIKVWNLKTGECTATFKGHESWVYSLAFFDGKLFSGSYDHIIKVWDLETGKCTATLTGHRGRVCSLAVFEGKLFSGSFDGTIKVWELKTGKCIATLKGDESRVFCLAFFDGKLIKVWDFTADDTTIFQEIADSLEGETQDVADVLERFSRMPKTAKDAIYGKLYAICQPFANEYSGCAEHAFYDQNRQSSTSVQRAQAIREYLSDQPYGSKPPFSTSPSKEGASSG